MKLLWITLLVVFSFAANATAVEIPELGIEVSTKTGSECKFKKEGNTMECRFVFKEIIVTGVACGSPADGELEVGDEIMVANEIIVKNAPVVPNGVTFLTSTLEENELKPVKMATLIVFRKNANQDNGGFGEHEIPVTKLPKLDPTAPPLPPDESKEKELYLCGNGTL